MPLSNQPGKKSYSCGTVSFSVRQVLNDSRSGCAITRTNDALPPECANRFTRVGNSRRPLRKVTADHLHQPPGELLLGRNPFIEILKFTDNCTPSPYPGIVFICSEPLDMSLLGNDIVRAEHVRIQIPLHDIGSFNMRFGCPACSTFISVDGDDLVSVSGGWRLSNPTIQALQAFIDQRGASSVYMSIGIGGGLIEVFSSVRAVAMDIKPGDGPNTLNPRSHGVVPIAILTTEEFDATSINVTSLRFGATGEEAAPLRSVLDDVDADGDTDLLVFFRTQDTNIDCETLFTYISGVTMTGVSIAGTDSVAVVGCH